MDVVYPVRPGEVNPQLRYSLRSLANLPDVKRVWLVGYKPSWVSGVEYIPGNRYKHNKWHNVPDNLRLACEQMTARRLLIMNDDFFITRPVKRLPSWHRGTLAEHIGTTRGPWQSSLITTERVLQAHGHDQPLSYEMHIPIVMERDKLAEVLHFMQPGAMPPQWRTLYGNWWRVPSEQMPDVKLRSPRDTLHPGSFISTEPFTFRRIENYLTGLFPEPSRYEAMAVAA